MRRIHNSPGNVVPTYSPKPLRTMTTQQAAARLRH